MSPDAAAPGWTMLTPRFTRAIDYARIIHAPDVRKQTNIPYVTHLLGVCTIVLEHGGDEDQAIGALLHDAAEDHGGAARLRHINAEFGPEVAHIVAVCSDSLADTAHQEKESWWVRKVRYLRDLDAHDPADPALLVSAADKLYNARAIVADYRELADELWSRFNPDAGRRGALWYYSRLGSVLGGKLRAAGSPALAGEFDRTVAELHTLCGLAVGENVIRSDAAAALQVELDVRAQLPDGPR